MGRDARLSSPELAAALIEGATSRDVDVVDLGLASTDLLYFASGSLDRPGVMITASHNPKQYNGLKFCLARAKPVGEESGLGEIRALTEKGDEILGTGHGDGPDARRPRCLRRSRAHVRGRGTDATPHGRRGHGQRDGGSRRAGGDGTPPGHAAPSLRGPRRHVPEPPGGPDRPGEPARPQARRPRAPRGRGHGVRRRCRSRVPGGRAGRRRERIRDDGADRGGDVGARAGGEGGPQPDLLLDRAGGDPGTRRRADPDPRRSLVHQAGDGGDGRDLRRRALGPLLLPGQLRRRLRSDRGGDRARRAVGGLGTAVRPPGAVPPLRELRRDQLPRGRTPRRRSRRSRRRSATAARTASTA